MDYEFVDIASSSDTVERHYHDSAGNYLLIKVEGDEIPLPTGWEVAEFLVSEGYDGPGDWREGA